jgi:hypothetical protein
MSGRQRGGPRGIRGADEEEPDFGLPHLKERAQVTAWWFMALGIWLVVTGIVVVCVTEISTTAKPLMPYYTILSSDLPNLGFQFVSYPFDIAMTTVSMAIGLVFFVISWWTADILSKNFMHADQWLRLALNVMMTLAITFSVSQISAITSVWAILVILGLASSVQYLNYMLDQANDRATPAAALINNAAVESGERQTDENLTQELLSRNMGIEEVRMHAHTFGWLSFVLYAIPIMAYLISTMIVQAAVEAVTPCPGRLWFSIVVFCAWFVFEVTVQILHGARYWYSSFWLRGIANFDPLTLGLRVLLYTAILYMMIGPAYQIHVLAPC